MTNTLGKLSYGLTEEQKDRIHRHVARKIVHKYHNNIDDLINNLNISTKTSKELSTIVKSYECFLNKRKNYSLKINEKVEPEKIYKNKKHRSVKYSKDKIPILPIMFTFGLVLGIGACVYFGEKDCHCARQDNNTEYSSNQNK